MLSFSGSLKLFVALEACDMRKGFNGLHALVAERLGEDLKQGALFVFSNRRHTRIKILCWDGTGIWVLTKRLVTHCPLYRICKAALSVSPVVSRRQRFSGNYWRAIRHARNATVRWHAAWDSGLDVRCGSLRGRAPFTSPDRAS
jgi:transposase